MPTTSVAPDIYKRPAELLQHLIRFDTTNPPGNETECVSYVNDLLTQAGIETTVLGRVPSRNNLVARLKGRGDAPPLLMQGHVDVVTTASQDWAHPPFGGELIDGYIWGRGALDMKGAVAMMISAMLRVQAEGFEPAGDIVLAVLSDEEHGGDYGAKWLVENHPELFEGIRYAIGEAGGFTLHMAGRKLYPIQVAEKQICTMRAVVHGPGGHGSMPMHGGAMAKLGQMLTTLDTHRLPVHITPVAEAMITEMAAAFPQQMGAKLLSLLDPEKTDAVLDQLGLAARSFDPVLHNTVNATIVQGGYKFNVIPSEISVDLDGRLLPGFGPDDALSELRALLGDDAEFEVERFDKYPKEPDLALFDMLADIVREGDPEAVPIPYLLGGVTDGRHFAQLGIQTYGFTPLLLPDDDTLMNTIHAADERVPIAAIEFGTDAIYKLLQRYQG